MDNSEKQVISACQAGNFSGFSTLYNRYIEKIYNFVYYRTMHKETAEDITSKVFFKSLKKIHTFNHDQGSFSSWLYKIAKNEIIDYYRSNHPADNIESFFDLRSSGDVSREIGAGLELEKVKRYLNRFSQEQREIVIMRIWDGLSHKEIANITGKSEANCKVIFSRTINKLREELPAELFLALLIKMSL